MSKERHRRESQEIQAYVRSLRKDVDKRLVGIRKKVSTLQGKAGETVTKRPVLALGVAFLIGMAVGVMLSKSND